MSAAPRWRRDLHVALLAGAALLLWDAAGLDLPITRWFGSAIGFAWREHWLTRGVLHEGGRALAWIAVLLLVVNLRWPLWRGPLWRERVGWLVLTVLCAAAVSAIKQFSATSCPWELAEFGGLAHYVSHWQWGLPDGGPGHCFPSGHASAAFALFSGYFMLREHRPGAARAWLLAVLWAGAAFGLAQLARGAHYPSHTLWSAWLCWGLCALAAPWLRAGQRPTLPLPKPLPSHHHGTSPRSAADVGARVS